MRSPDRRDLARSPPSHSTQSSGELGSQEEPCHKPRRPHSSLPPSTPRIREECSRSLSSYTEYLETEEETLVLQVLDPVCLENQDMEDMKPEELVNICKSWIGFARPTSWLQLCCLWSLFERTR